MLTRVLAPMTQHLPMVTPGRIVTFAPIHVSSPTVMGAYLTWCSAKPSNCARWL